MSLLASFCTLCMRLNMYVCMHLCVFVFTFAPRAASQSLSVPSADAVSSARGAQRRTSSVAPSLQSFSPSLKKISIHQYINIYHDDILLMHDLILYCI